MPDDYALLDCGAGERLERFARTVVRRPAPGATFPRRLPAGNWGAADLTFTREAGWSGSAPPEWKVELAGVCLILCPAAGGQIGVFPEHMAVGEAAIPRLAGAGAGTTGTAGARVLNLFAHTGLTTLRFLAVGADVTHVDAAPAAVRRARENAELSGLKDRPARWIADDALAFLRREARRGVRYDCIAADPPAYGRRKGSRGDWKLERDLGVLLELCANLLTPGGLLCLTSHRRGLTPLIAAEEVRSAWPDAVQGSESELELDVDASELALTSLSGNTLPAGVMVLAGRRAIP